MYEIPVLHPLIVHFPVAYLLLAGAGGLLYGLTGRRGWRNLTAVLLAVGVLGGLAAMLTGEAMEEFSAAVPAVQELVETHETMALISVIVGATAFGLLAFAFVTRKLVRAGGDPKARDAFWLRVGVAVLCLAVAALVAYTGHLGGQMTWGQ